MPSPPQPPGEPPTPLAALNEKARTDPDEPCLFYRPALDWHWCSWAELSAAVRGLVDRLGAQAAGSRIAFADRATPAAVAADLAIQAAGLVAVAETRAGELGGCAARLDDPDLFRRPPLRGGRTRPAPAIAERASGGVEIVLAGGPKRLEVTELAGVARAAFRPLPPPSDRDVLVFCASFADGTGRLLLTWAQVSGASVVLEPEPEAWLATSTWVRPTLLAGTAPEILRFHAALGASPLRRRWWRRGLGAPIDRLRAVVVLGAQALPAAEIAFWQGLDVQVLALDEKILATA